MLVTFWFFLPVFTIRFRGTSTHERRHLKSERRRLEAQAVNIGSPSGDHLKGESHWCHHLEIHVIGCWSHLVTIAFFGIHFIFLLINRIAWLINCIVLFGGLHFIYESIFVIDCIILLIDRISRWFSHETSCFLAVARMLLLASCCATLIGRPAGQPASQSNLKFVEQSCERSYNSFMTEWIKHVKQQTSRWAYLEAGKVPPRTDKGETRDTTNYTYWVYWEVAKVDLQDYLKGCDLSRQLLLAHCGCHELSSGKLGASIWHPGNYFGTLGAPSGTMGAAGRTHGDSHTDS